MTDKPAFQIISDEAQLKHLIVTHFRPEPLKVLMCDPTCFDIIDVKNVHMEGMAASFNKSLAIKQWNDLHGIYLHLLEQQIIDDLQVIPGAEGCEDMVFCANQTFPWLDQQGKKQVVMSLMRHPSRQREVPFFESYFSEWGYEPIHLNQSVLFEGMGDTIPHPGKRLLYGGFGHRTDPSSYKELSEVLNTPIVILELPNPNFYHLDTCFVPLSDNAVMYCKEAFTKQGIELIEASFEKHYIIPEQEAIETFCLNAHVIHNPINGKKAAIIQKGSRYALHALQDQGYEVYETDTSEFMKSGGSVFCMKMMCY